MRRLTLVAICGLLALSACTSDDRSSSPTEPGPEAVTVPRCRPTPFPVLSLTNQIIRIFPVSGGLQANALVRMTAIGAFWTVCRTTDAQTGVASFVRFMVQQFQATKLIGGKSAASSTRVLNLTNDLYRAVGLTPPNFSPEAVGDGNNFGNGLFIPGQALTVRTGNNEAGTRIPANGFTQPTLITIFKRTTSGFTSPPQPIFAPFFEITASNAAGTHYLTGTNTAVVGFCVDDDFLATLTDPAIAHQAVAEGANPGGFEVPPEATAAQYATLGLACPQAPTNIGALDLHGFTGFAFSAWRKAEQVAGPIMHSLLPDEAQAAAVAAKSGLGTLARSLSPFAVTDRGSALHLEFIDQEGSALGGNIPLTGGEDFFVFDLSNDPTIQWCEGCFDEGEVTKYPSVTLRDSEGNPIGGVQIQVTLQQIGTIEGAFTSGSSTLVTTESDPSSSFGQGTALFDNLSIDVELGESHPEARFRLVFSVPSAPSVDPLVSHTFDVDVSF
jgi:hypothetical protein